MSFKNVAASALLFMVAFNEVTSWTIDLPEARKYFFSQADKGHHDRDVIKENRVFYDNIRGNSLHNHDNNKNHRHSLNSNADSYAEHYKYSGYMEKKVHHALKSGSRYLDGLRYSIERYGELLEVCNRSLTSFDWPNLLSFYPVNTTTTLPLNLTDLPTISNFSGSFNGVNYTNVNITDVLLEFFKEWNVTCGRATEKKEYVRRLVDLALWTTKRLEDNAYGEKYHKNDDKGQEDALILRLAWYLDRLAHLTGFEPNIEKNIPSTTTSAPPVEMTTPPVMLDVPPEVMTEIMSCLKRKSSEPATVRCAYPLPLPPLVQLVMGFSETQTTPSPLVNQPQPPADPVPAPSSEVLIADASTSTKNSHPSLSDVKTVRKRSIDENTLMKIMKYYAKHKVWVNSNPSEKEFENINGNYEVSNSLPEKSVQKRSLSFKKSKHLRLNRHRFQGLTRLLKHKDDLHYPKPKLQAVKVKEYLGKMRKSNIINDLKHKISGEHLSPKNIHKRSIDTKNNGRMKLPEDPMPDLSKYVKSKPGVHYIKDKTLMDKIKEALQNIRNNAITKKKILRQKRSLVKSNVLIQSPTHYPHNHPIQDFGKFIQHKAKVQLQKTHFRAHKLKETITKLFHASAHSQKSVEHVKKIHKRSVRYGDVYKPRISENPHQDISYYIKNRKGVNYNYNVAQALQVRAGLEQVFQTGNIEVVRRYGSNYNPLIPNPFMFGILRTVADF